MSLAVANRDGGKTSERGFSDPIRSMFTGNVISGFRVRENSPLGMSIRLGGEYNSTTGANRDSLLIDDGIRAYEVFTDDGAAITVSVDTAHASLPRLDSVVVYIDKSQARSASVLDNNNGVVKAKVVAGTPASTPAAPTGSAIQTSIGASNPYVIVAQVAVAAAVTQVTQSNITDQRVMAKANDANTNAETRLSESLGDFVASGLVWSQSSGLNGTMTSGVAYVSGKRLVVSSIASRTFTASKDTYVSLDSSGTVSYSEVANGAASPALPANSIWVAVVVTSGSAITSIRLGGTGGSNAEIYPKNNTGAWKAWTPIWTASGTTPSIGNGTLTGAYMQMGKTVFFRIKFVGGSSTNWGTGNYFITLPVAGYSGIGANDGFTLTGYAEDAGVAAYSVNAARMFDSSRFYVLISRPQDTVFNPWAATGPFNWSTGDYWSATGFYEAA